MVRISTYNSRDLSFIHLPALVTALKNDPDLSSIEPALLPQIFQTLFVATGCDYISFFSGIGNSTFLLYFYQHSQFITGRHEIAPGTLANVGSDLESGFMGFLRLVGVVYMKKHGSGFSGISPEAYYNQFLKPGQTALQHHNIWLDSIRQCIWDRIQFENDMIPNTDTLCRHWKRTCWVLDLWKQADTNTIITKPITDYGWKVLDGNLSVEWDRESNMDAVKERVAGLLKGCGCRTGCQTRQCGCRSKEKACGEGCTCRNCTNTELQTITSNIVVDSLEEESTSIPDDMNELMEWVFGDTANEEEGDSEEDTEHL